MVPFQNHSMFRIKISNIRQEILFSFELPLNQLAKQRKRTVGLFSKHGVCYEKRGQKKMNIATYFAPKGIQILIKIVMFGISFNRKTPCSLYLNSIMTLPDANVCIWSFNLPNNQETLSNWNLALVNIFIIYAGLHEIS